jgi:hypothetical protein
MLQLRADLSASCRHFGRLSSALLFFARDIPERGRSISFSFSDINDSDWREPSGTRVAIQSRYEWHEVNRWIAEEESMDTALAVTQQQSIEVTDRGWARIHNTDRCPRCSGLMVAEWCEDLSDHTAQRCVQCGEVIDPVILHNRGTL